MAGGGTGGHGRVSWAPWHRSWALPPSGGRAHYGAAVRPPPKSDQHAWPPLVPGPQGTSLGGAGPP
eukprot:899297-Pyramimonas_sp.AAC.1